MGEKLKNIELKINDKIAKVPIIQGGMGVGLSLSGLASAVAREGGIGVIATAGIGYKESDFDTNYCEANKRALRKEIRKARENSNGGLLGVNIMVALTNYADMVRTSIEEGIDFIFSGAGLPLKLPGYLKEFSDIKTRLVPIVSSARAFRLICKNWIKKFNYLPDAVVVEGPMAGGHLGYSYDELNNNEVSLKEIFNEVMEVAKEFSDKISRAIPVIVGGGIFSADDVAEYISLGASGVQLGTRFVATYESDASEKVKDSYIKAKKDDVRLIKSPVGMPGRAIANDFLLAVERGEKIPYKCPYHCIKTCKPNKSPYCIAYALINANKGNLDEGFAFSGSNVYRINRIMSVKELIEELISKIK